MDIERDNCLRAKLSDFGACITAPSPTSGFRGVSYPWTAPEAAAARGFDELAHAEMFSLGLVLWAIAMDGRQFDCKYWGRDPERERQNVDIEEIERIKAGGNGPDGLLEIAVTSLQSYLRGFDETYTPLAPYKDIEVFADTLKVTIVSHPARREKSADVLVAAFSSESSRVSKPKGTANSAEFSGEIDLAYLSSTYGPGTKLDVVASLIFQNICKLGKEIQFAPSLFHASLSSLVGFGTDVDYSLAQELMKQAASAGLKRAQGLHAAVLAIENSQTPTEQEDFQEARSATSQDDLMFFDDLGLEDQEEPGTEREQDSISEPRSDDDIQKEWLIEAAAAGSWVACKLMAESDPAGLLRLRSRSKHRFGCHRGIPNLCSDREETCECDEESAVGSDWTKITERNQLGETPLIYAMRTGNLDAVVMLLPAVTDPTVTDDRGVTALHWLVSMSEESLHHIQPLLTAIPLDIQSQVAVEDPRYYGTRFEPGTPLDWAVDGKNISAVRMLLELGADPALEPKTRPSALHRAAACHDIETCRIILSQRPDSRIDVFDRHGQSPLSSALQPHFALERRLLHLAPGRMILQELIDLFATNGADISFVNQSGENMLYCAVREGFLEGVETVLGWSTEQLAIKSLITIRTGPNRWSSLRRALYATDIKIIKAIFRCLAPEELYEILEGDRSPDGLTLLHELAFLPESTALDIARLVVSKLNESNRSLQGCVEMPRMSDRGSRPNLTAFQLAVLCRKSELADYFVKYGADPLAGVQKQRFLGSLISYLRYQADVPSGWLLHVRDDKVPNTLRRFPHPVLAGDAVGYLLRHETIWWQGRATFDNDPDHDPMIAWRPGVSTSIWIAYNTIQGRGSMVNDSYQRAIEMYGTSGHLDTNTLVFRHRSRHVRDYKSFLICYQHDPQKESSRRHPYITALELAFDVAVTCPYRVHGEKLFCKVLETYNGPTHCNFPYYHYFPWGRSPMRNLSRRNTLLHQAIRLQKPSLVSALLENGADWDMPTLSWQTPLRLANIMNTSLSPDDQTNRGTFLQRLNPSVPPVAMQLAPEEAESEAQSPTRSIQCLLETHAMRYSRQRNWAFIKAFREVHWPWNEYETDQLGVRFIFFYVSLLSLFFLIISAPLYILYVYKSWITFIEFSDARDAVTSLLIVADCVMLAIHNGLNPQEACLTKSGSGVHALTEYMFPPLEQVSNMSIATANIVESCFNGTLPDRLQNTTCLGDYTAMATHGLDNLIPGCSDHIPKWMDLMATFDAADKALNAKMQAYLLKECKCQCGWRGTPYHHKWDNY
ncbi:hypothetical protein BDV27DRAFT_35498 [Aspergillus caelatus]|uniref:Protein kinase domain-containing protein n=1 Tax=Aspergillus caelatus TaxID=61420 RepID=A0A5N7AL89_9EURO|nr:uncharacterized protein BDV27DRAFT_35498 [Aspergillus caelatus]KAE8370611.1 hypothetical protein BDV27DRAFT_35498 [Aspergillus caelatus]